MCRYINTRHIIESFSDVRHLDVGLGQYLCLTRLGLALVLAGRCKDVCGGRVVADTIGGCGGSSGGSRSSRSRRSREEAANAKQRTGHPPSSRRRISRRGRLVGVRKDARNRPDRATLGRRGLVRGVREQDGGRIEGRHLARRFDTLARVAAGRPDVDCCSEERVEMVVQLGARVNLRFEPLNKDI